MAGPRSAHRIRRMKGHVLSRVLAKLADLGLAVLFLAAAVPKIAEPADFAEAIATYRISPAWAVAPLAHFLPWLEVLCAALLALGPARTVCRRTLLGMLVAYTLVTGVAVARGIDIRCGCFGGQGGSAWLLIVRNVGILLAYGTVRLLVARLDKTGTRRDHLRRGRPLASAQLLALTVATILLGAAPASARAALPAERIAVEAASNDPLQQGLRPGGQSDAPGSRRHAPTRPRAARDVAGPRGQDSAVSLYPTPRTV